MSRPSLMSSKLIRKLGNLSLMINSTQPTYPQATSSGRSSQSSPRALEASARGKASVTFDWCKDLLTREVVCFRTTWVTWSTKGTRRGFYSCGSSARLNWRATSRKIDRISWSPCGPSCSRRSSWASGARLLRIDDLIDCNMFNNWVFLVGDYRLKVEAVGRVISNGRWGGKRWGDKVSPSFSTKI